MTNFAMQYKLLFGKFNSLAADNKWRVLESYLLRISVQQANWARRTPLQFHHKYTSWFPPYILAFGGVLQ